MVKKEYHSTRADGVKLYKSYSTDNFKIRQVETGHVYDTAIDVEGAPFTYEETGEPVTGAVKKYSTLKIIRALSTDPVFAAFIANVPAELREKLDDCLWEEE